MRRRWRPLARRASSGVAIVSSLVLTLAACSAAASPSPAASSGAASPGAASPSAAASAGTGTASVIHFFSVNGITGQSAAYGGPSAQEEQLFVDNINSKGGFTDSCGNKYTLKLTVYDMANSAEQAVAGIRQAAADPSVLVVLGPTPDTGNVPMTPVAGELKIPYIIPAYGTPITTWNPYAFRVETDAGKLVPVFLKQMQSVLGMKSIAQLYDQTQNSQAAEAAAIKQEAGNLGVQVVAYEAYSAGDTDFRPQLTKIKALNPDWLMVDAAAPEAATIVNQASQLGITSKLYISEAANLFPSVWDSTSGKVAGTYTATPGVVAGVTPQDPDAVNLFKAKNGQDPNIYGTWGWDAAAVAVDAIKRACTGTDRAKVAAALANTKDFPMAITGKINWTNPPSGDNQTPTVVVVKVTGSGVGQPIQ